jgi:cysteine-S-conjugate beta-lyase
MGQRLLGESGDDTMAAVDPPVPPSEHNAPLIGAHDATRIIHDHRNPGATHGFVNGPAYRGSTVLFPTLDKIRTRDQAFTYGRRGTPTTVELERAIASLEGAEQTILTASGYQAVTTAILAYVQAGDNILVTDSVYQPTRAFCDRNLL